MIISDKKKLSTIEEEFSQLFPHLKLKFYKFAHKPLEGSRAGEEWDDELTIGEIRTQHNKLDFKITEDLSVNELETKFSSDLGLNVQVFRESTNGVWLQTVATDNWTLKKHSEKARLQLSN